MRKKIHIGIINGGFGNISSVKNALNFLNLKNTILESPDKLRDYTHFIMPGVGSFKKASTRLRKNGWFDALIDISKHRPILGICLGMQLMFLQSNEDGVSKGIGFFNGNCEKFKSKKLPIPHIGFNHVFQQKKTMIWKSIPNNSPFYFVHSYRVSKVNEKCMLSFSNYGEKFISVVEKDNLIGVQFHPEKSHTHGLAFIKNFSNIS